MKKPNDETVCNTESSHPVNTVGNEHKKKRKKMKKHKKKATVNFSGILYDCTYCNRFFPSKHRLEDHVKEIHADLVACEEDNTQSLAAEFEYDCKHCKQCFPSHEELQQHVNDNHCIQDMNRQDMKNDTLFSKNVSKEAFDDCNLECTSCNLFFSSADTLKRHQEMHICEVVVDCPCCSDKVRTPNPNVRSIETQTHQFHSCDMCDSKFENTQDLQWHLLNNHKITPSPVQLNSPKRPGRPRRPRKPKQQFLCKFCPKQFPTIQAVKDHQNTHTGYAPYSCKDCGISFQRKSTLKTHEANHQAFACSQCGKLFTNLARLQMHFVWHDESEKKDGAKEKNWICHKCGQTYGRKSHLTMHMKRHAGIRSYSCEHCGKAFYTSHNLKEHLWTHTGEKPYLCTREGCLKRFTQKSHLNYHLKSHARKEAQLQQVYQETTQQRTEANIAQQNESQEGPNVTQQIVVEDSSHVEEGIQEEEVNTTPHAEVQVPHQDSHVKFVLLESQTEGGQEVKSTEMEAYHQPASLFITEIHSYSEQVIRVCQSN